MPTSAELKRMRKLKEKAERDLKVLKEREALQQDIQKKQSEIRALTRKQGGISRLISRATKEWKATEATRKRLLKEAKRAYKEVERRGAAD